MTCLCSIASGTAVAWAGSTTKSWYASSIRIVVDGDAARTRSTKAATVFAGWIVDVGLFGLQKNTIPAPLAATAIPSRSSLSALSTRTDFTGAFIFAAIAAGFSQVGI